MTKCYDIDTRETDLLRDARSILRDQLNGWPTKELHMNPYDLCEAITLLLDDGYSMETGDCEDPDEGLTCDTCGRVGNREDGIEPGGPCQEPCEGIVRRVSDSPTFHYEADRYSTKDGSPAMMVTIAGNTIVLVNEDGFQWQDNRADWVTEPEFYGRFPNGIL